jgi:hypothetical protein
MVGFSRVFYAEHEATYHGDTENSKELNHKGHEGHEGIATIAKSAKDRRNLKAKPHH